MSELEIQPTNEQTTPDAVKAEPIDQFEKDQKEALKKADETRVKLNPEQDKKEDSLIQKIGKRAKLAEDVQTYGPVVAPLVGADILAQATEGIVGGTLDEKGKQRITQQRDIGTLSYNDFKEGIRNNSIQEYQGKNFIPVMAEQDDALLNWWSKNIGQKQTVAEDGKISIAKTYLEGADVTPEGKYVPRKNFLETHDPYLFKIFNNSKERQLTFQTKVLSLVKDKIGGNTNIDSVGQNRVQQILVNNISNTEFIPVLQERLKEISRGTFLELPALAKDFGVGYVDELAERITELRSATGASFLEAWSMTEPFRNKKTAEFRKSFAEIGVTQLSDVINKTIIEDLEQQKNDGIITPQRFEQLTQTKLSDGTVLPTQFVSESDAQGILELSFESLNSPEQFATILGENMMSMISIGGASQALVKKFGFDQIEMVKQAMKKNPELAKLGVAGAAFRLKSGSAAGKLNLVAIKRGLETQKQEAYQIRLSNTIEEKRGELDVMLLSGKADSADFKILKNEIDELVTKRYVDKIKLSTLPILRSTVKEAFPLSLGQYYFGEAYQFFNPEMSQFEGEMWGALTYIAGGGFTMKAVAGKVGRGLGNVFYNPTATRSRIVKNLGDFLANNKVTSGLVDFIRTNQFIQVGKGLILPNADLLKRYNQKLIDDRGFGLSKDEFKSSRYVLELASVMDEKNLDRTLDTITQYTTMETKFINSFPEEVRDTAAELYRSNFAQASGIGALEAASALVNNKMNFRDIKSLKHVDEMIDLDNLNTEQVRKNNFAIKTFRDMLKDKGIDITTNQAGLQMLDVLEQANINFIKRLDDQMITLDKTLKQMKRVYFSDPTKDIPESFHENVSLLEERIGDRITKIKGMEADFADIENQATDVNKFFLDRINKLNTMADSDEAYINGTRLLVEEFISHTMGAGRRYAARGYRETEQLAERLKVKIDLTDSIFAMKNMKQELATIPLKMLFSKEGAFFNSVMGRKAYVSFQRMARNGLNDLDPTVRVDLEQMATNPKSEHFISQEATELDIALYWSDWFKKNGTADAPVKFQPFLATPKDINTMQTAFVEFGYKIGDESLAKQYIEYGESLGNLVTAQSAELGASYKKAAELYQNEYFDRIRKGFMGKLITARDGPRTVAGKLKGEDIAKMAREEGIDLDKDSLKILKGDVAFKFAYKNNMNPLTAFKPMVDQIIKLSKEKNAVASSELKEIFSNLQFNFGGRVGGKPVFDLTTPKGKQDFEMITGLVSTMVRANWATKATSELKKATSPRARIALRKQEGYDFTTYENLDSISSSLTFKVREIDENGNTVVRNKQAIDLTSILSQQKDIVAQMGKHEELRDEYGKLVNRFEDQKDELIATTKTDSKIEQFIFQEVEKLGSIGGDPEKFYDEYVTRGRPEKLRKLKDKILKELTSDPNMTEVDLEVTRKKINDGIASLIAKGGLARAGLRTGKGMVRDEDVPDVFFDPKIEGKDTLPFNLSSRTKIGIDGQKHPIQVLQTPQDLVLDLQDANKRAVFQEVMDQEHFSYFENMVGYMALVEKGDFSRVKLEGLTRGISTNEAISRAFNLARGMVSPTYVAAEFAVRIAEMRGIQLLGLVAQDKEAARIMKDMFTIGVKPSERDVGKLSELIVNFVFKDLARAGLEPPKYVPTTEAELAEAEEKLIEQYKKEKEEEES
jgi:hypothetical protein